MTEVEEMEDSELYDDTYNEQVEKMVEEMAEMKVCKTAGNAVEPTIVEVTSKLASLEPDEKIKELVSTHSSPSIATCKDENEIIHDAAN